MKKTRLFHAIIVTGCALVGTASGCGVAPENETPDVEQPIAFAGTDGGLQEERPDAGAIDSDAGMDAGIDAGIDAGMDAGWHPTK
jgi:hypothetical protein